MTQYEAWQRARLARAGAPVSFSSTSSGPSTRGSSQQGGTPMSLGTASAQSVPLMIDSPTTAAGAVQIAAPLPDPGVGLELQMGDTAKTSPRARSRAALRAAAAAAGSKFGL